MPGILVRTLTLDFQPLVNTNLKGNKPTENMKPTTKEYHERIASLEERFNDVNRLHGLRDALKAEAEQHRTKRDEVLASAVADTSEKAIDELARHNAKAEVLGAKIKHIEGPTEQAEEDLQHFLNADFLSPFRGLHSALLRYRLERAKAQIAKLIAPERARLFDGQVEQLARHTREYVEGEALAIYAPDGVATPLHETFPGSGWGQPEQRQATLRIVMNAVQDAIEKGKQLLAAVEAEKGFEPPEIAQPQPAAAVEVTNPNLVDLVEA